MKCKWCGAGISFRKKDAKYCYDCFFLSKELRKNKSFARIINLLLQRGELGVKLDGAWMERFSKWDDFLIDDGDGYLFLTERGVEICEEISERAKRLHKK